MTTRPQDPARGDAEKALEEALAVAPSPEFVARVRDRVREAPARAAAGWWLRVAVAGAAVMAVVVAAAWWDGRAKPDRVAVADRTMASAPAGAPVLSHGPEPSRAQTRTPDNPMSRSTAPRAAAPRRIVTRAAASEQPREVLVPGDERRALDRLLAAMREGRVAVPAPRRVLEDENGRLLEPQPIEIPLMKPIEPLPGMAADRSGGKEK